MKQRSLVFLFGVISFLSAQAQRLEVGLQLGASNYWGDLSSTIAFNETHPAGGVYGRINFNHTWALKAEINSATVSGSDANSDNYKKRNLSFQSQVTELNLLLEFNYLKYGPHVLHTNLTSYVFVGMGAFMFEPKAKLHDVWYNLRDYRTEGVGYGTYAFSIPFGIGLKYMITKKFSFETQLGFRKTFTDYLDDVSGAYPDVQAMYNDGGRISAVLSDRSVELYGTPQFQKGYRRGDPGFKDWYFVATAGIGFRLNTKQKCARFF